MKLKFTSSKQYIFSLLLILFSYLSYSHEGVLKGVVSDSASNQAISFVSVLLEGDGKKISATTDELGHFKFQELEEGTYQLSFFNLGYERKTVSVVLKDDEIKVVSISIKLTKKSLKLSEITVSSSRDLGQTMNTITSLDMQLRPVNSAQDLMRLVPGLFIAQHQGGGKAEQIFLRGFDADHGTDFAVFWDGMPVNMPSHAHGQGYADSHFMIPESIDQLDVYKGTYATQYGDFATAGAASFTTKNYVDNMIKVEAGNYGMNRVMGMLNLLGKDQHIFSKYKESLYITGEAMYNKASYFVNPQEYSRFGAFMKYYGQLSEKNILTMEGSSFNATWNGSGQIPQRAVDEGIITRFGAIDPSEGGQTSRTNANVILKTFLGNGAVLKNQLFYSYYKLNLFTDFTFFLRDSVHGDGINQRDNGRNVFGYNGSYEINNEVRGKNLKSVFGITTRSDIGQIALRDQQHRTILDTVSMGNLYEQSVSAYINETYNITSKFYINAGIRADVFYMSYHDIRGAKYDTADGTKLQAKVSPKLNLYYNVTPQVQLFARSGYGFHSNDARVVVANPNVITLPTALGYEIGSTFKPIKNMIVNAVLWGIHIQNELVYDPDIAQTEINGPTQRLGADLSVRYQLTNFLFFDLDVNYSHGRYTNLPNGQNYIPLAPTLTSVAGLTVKAAKGLTGSFRYRYIDSRPANDNNTVVAQGYFLLDAVVRYRVKNYQLGLTVENILNVNWNEAQFDTLTRLKGESPAGIDQLCFTPGAPRLIRGSLSYFF
jgi:outer membrane receptor protein involved in Fe transport